MNPFSSQRKNASAFTLVELLIVIAIIAILAAILFPVFSRTRENARRSSCQSNLKQLTMGMKQYVQDYDERFAINQVGSTSVGWANGIQPYLKSDQVFQCPSDTVAPPTVEPIIAQAQYSDYFYNVGLARGNGGNTKIGALESQLDYPSSTICFGDYSNTRTLGAFAYSTDRGGGNQGLASSSNPGWTKHLEGINVSFADGHVKWYKGTVGSNASTKIYRVHHPFESGLTAFGGVTGSSDSPTYHVSDAITNQPAA